MNRLFATLSAVLIAVVMMAQTNAPAFPGAEGHGRYVTGGRGGEVRHVTNLSDSGTGSLRAAVNGSAKKIVVFDVGGIIELKSELKIGDNTTILGQTAPNPGITLRYYTVQPNGNNIIMRFIRIRRGEEKNVNEGADATWARQFTGMILDHCSFSWSIDEIASFYDNRDFTMQWCTLGEALANAGHGKGEHSYGGIWGGKGASFHHNFLCHMQNRVPRFCGARYNWTGYDKTKYSSSIEAEIVDFRNCVMYNWGNGNGCYGGTGGGNINIVNNYYKAGPATANKTRVTQVSVATSSNAEDSPFMGYASRYYIDGNYVTAAGDNAANYDWSGVKYDNGLTTINGERYIPDADHKYGSNVEYVTDNGTDYVRLKLDSPVDKGEVTTHNAETAYEKVLAYVGASLYRDGVDARYMDETRNGTTHYKGATVNCAGILDKVADQGVYKLESTKHPEGFDTDGDGMPDAWETANGLNPNDASDATTYTLDSKGFYTNLEVYANALVEDIMKQENDDALEPVSEYYPTVQKADGVPYYDGTAAKGTFGQDDDNTNPNTDPIDGATGTIKWSFDGGTASQTPDISSDIAGGITETAVTLGSDLVYDGTQNVSPLTETKIKSNAINTANATDANAITFTLKIKEGYQFKATKVSFDATKLGTDGGKIDVSWRDANGTTTLATAQTPARNNADPNYTHYSYDLSAKSGATSDECALIINLYALGIWATNNGVTEANCKDYGFANINIEGTLGTVTAGISTVTQASIPVGTEYYDLNGRRLTEPGRGVSVRVERMANGQRVASKVIK